MVLSLDEVSERLAAAKADATRAEARARQLSWQVAMSQGMDVEKGASGAGGSRSQGVRGAGPGSSDTVNERPLPRAPVALVLALILRYRKHLFGAYVFLLHLLVYFVAKLHSIKTTHA